MNIIKYSEFQHINEEGGWETIKYGLSKLGRYKANGKILGKGETDKKAAEEIGEIMGDTANAVIKATYEQVKKVAPEFPNDKKREKFLEGIINYGQLYDSIVAAAAKKSNEDGYLDPNIANKLIENLRVVVKKALDTDLKAVYSVMDSKENIDLEVEELMFERLFTQVDSQVNEEFLKGLTNLKNKVMDKVFGKKDGDSEQRIAGSRQSAKFQTTSNDKTVDSERMKTLASNKLPMILMGVGASLGALGWIAQTEWFKNWVLSIIQTADKVTQTPAVIKTITGGPADSKGFIHWASQIGGKKILTAGDMQEFITKHGAENVSHMFDGNNAGDSMGQVEKLQQMISNNPKASVGEIFNKADQTFGSAKGVQDLFSVNSAATFVAKIVIKEATKTVVKGGLVTGGATVLGLLGMAPIVTAIGIALVGAGLVTKLLREKGLRQSRAKTLNDLLQSLKLVNVTSSNDDVVNNDDTTSQDNVVTADSSSIYKIMIKNLTALNSMLISYTGVTLEGEDDGRTKKVPEVVDDVKDMENSELLELEPVVELDEKEQSDAEVISLKPEDVSKSFDEIYKELVEIWKKQQTKLGKENLTPGEGTRKRLRILAKFKVLAAEWVKNQEEEGKNTKPGQGTRTRLMRVAKEWYNATYVAKEEKTEESIVSSYKDFLFEKQFTKGPRSSVVNKDETYLTQAVQNIRKSIKSIKDENDKGVAITPKFVQDILDVKMSSDSKKPIKDLYKLIYEYLYGKNSQTLSNFGPLYKESIDYLLPKSSTNPQGGKLQVVAEKIARLAKRTLQFEGEGFYSGIGEFGEDLKDFNETLKQIMDYYKNNPKTANESKIISFTKFK
jgi:hypothetical protein